MGSIPYGVIGIFYWHNPDRTIAFNRNEYQEYFLGGKRGRCIGPITSPPSCADCHEIWDPQPPGTLHSSGLYRDCFTFTFINLFLV